MHSNIVLNCIRIELRVNTRFMQITPLLGVIMGYPKESGVKFTE